ncbi:MAG TPA: extracellular solute-binding protein [Firmicutes bacterium]|jgi:multiple sugar transport system substrate-binding protein|nr:MAG: hypothetical protein AA931_12805 [Peptococcaceae bacterium 1109]HHT73295.1 extracellular solute-binding protein [Bacillota bacterium]
MTVLRKASSLYLLVFLVVCLAGSAFAQEITFSSTQFVPIEEQEFARNHLLAPFTEQTGIKVNLICEDDGPFFDRLTAEARAGKAVSDVFGTLHGNVPILVAEGVAADLGDITAIPGRTYISEFVNLGQMDGKQVYVPWMQATYVMMANKKALDYLPEGADLNALTYEELLEWAKVLYEETGGPKLGLPAGPSGLFGRMLHGYLYPSFTGYQVSAFNSPEAVAMWEYLKELNKYVHPSTGIWASMSDPLLFEEVWLAWDHTARLTAAVREKPEEFIAFPAPAGPKGRAFITVLTGIGVTKGSENFDAAMELIKYLTSPDVQVKVLEGTGFFPTTLEAVDHIPDGPEKILADAVSRQAASPDAIVSLLPVGLGGRTGEFVPLYVDTYQAIVVMNRPIQETLDAQWALLKDLFESMGAEYPNP